MIAIKRFLPYAMLMLAGCSTLGLGSGSKVVIRTTPSQANVFFVDPSTGQSALIGKTPVTFERADYGKQGNEVIQLRVEKENFESRFTAVTAFGSETTFVDMTLSAPLQAKGEIREAFELSRRYLEETNRLLLAKRFGEALVTIEKVVQLDPKNGDAFAAKGSVLYLMKDFEGANNAWTQALLINPSLDSVRESLIDLSQERVRREPATAERN